MPLGTIGARSGLEVTSEIELPHRLAVVSQGLLEPAGGFWKNRRSLRRRRLFSFNLGRRLILAQPFAGGLPHQAGAGPASELDLRDGARLGAIHLRERGASVQGTRAYVQNGVEPIRDEYLAAGNF